MILAEVSSIRSKEYTKILQELEVRSNYTPVPTKSQVSEAEVLEEVRSKYTTVSTKCQVLAASTHQRRLRVVY